MPLIGLTITGADDETDIDEMLDLTSDHTFLEWGILFGREAKQGTTRYPTSRWIEDWLAAAEDSWTTVSSAAHLCFPWPRNLSCNALTWDEIYRLRDFNRIQVNQSYHEVNQDYIKALFLSISNIGKPVIFQNNGTLPVADIDHYVSGMTCSTIPQVLFDCSGGRGVEIKDYPEPLSDMLCGYAGGIGPENIERVLTDLAQKFPKAEYWVDMESRVRTEDHLDLNKIKACVEIAAKFVEEENV